MKKRNIINCCIIIGLVFIDQLIKYFILKYLNGFNDIVVIKNFLSITFVKNTGGAFGLFSGSTYIIAFITMILIYFLIKFISEEKNNVVTASYVLIVSGAIGNLIDRVYHNFVIDFISFKLFGHYFPVFNFADILITVGVILFFYCIVKDEKDERVKRDKSIKRRRK